MQKIKVIFKPNNLVGYFLKGTSIYEAGKSLRIIADTPCGGHGICGKCKVQILKGQCNPNSTEREKIAQDDLNKGYRLACQTKISKEMVIFVPYSTRFVSAKVLVSGERPRIKLNPNITKICIKLQEPSLSNNVADFENMKRCIKRELQVDVNLLREIPQKLRRFKFHITLVMHDNELIEVEQGNTVAQNYGIAFDIGTVTLVGTLLNLSTGEPLSVAWRINPQISFGEDIISRINYANLSKKGIKELNSLIINAINGMIDNLAYNAGINVKNIYEVVIVGNTVMHHLLLMIDTQTLAVSPYIPTIKSPINVRARKLGIKINPRGNIYFFPNIAGFVGGDTVSVILASLLHKSNKIKLAIDIGTNGEIVLGSKHRLICCSTAAGPAFEGAHIECGMPAFDGAIEKVFIENDELQYNVIGEQVPKGICGSGLIDAVAELLKIGVIEQTGRILSKDALRAKVNDKLLERIIENGNELSFLLAYDRAGKSIVLTQQDIRKIQIAKGAIRAGIEILKKQLGIDDKDIEEVLLAGAFGNYIRADSARIIGLVPPIPTKRIKFVGNAASTGAKIALLSKDAREEAKRIAEFVEYVELAGRSDFQEEFIKAMNFGP